MKIVHVLRRFDVENWGGIEECVFNLAKEQKRLGHEVQIICTKALCQIDRDIIDGIKIKRFDYFYPYLFLSKEARMNMDYKGGNPYSLSMIKYIKTLTPDVVHCHTMGRIQKSIKKLCENMNVKFLSTLHGGLKLVSTDEEQQLFKPKVYHLPYGFLLKSIYNSEKDYAKVCISIAEKEKNSKSYYIQNGVSQEFDTKVVDIRELYNIPKGKKIILNVARIDKQKNQRYLVEALLHTPENYHLILCGNVTDREYYNEIKELINDLNLEERITFIHDIKPRSSRLSSLYKDSFCFALPSIHEPFGIVVLEAWQFGLPVIANVIGGIKDLSSKGHCLSLNIKDKYSLKHNLFNLYLKRDSIKNFIQKNVFLVDSEYSWRNVAQKYINLYHKQELL